MTSNRPADRPLTPDSRHRLAPVLLAAADVLRQAGRPDDPITGETGELAGVLVDGVLRAGSTIGAVADAQADACYALLAEQLGVSPLEWDGTRAQAVTALTTAARKAGPA
jgi:hypothetical protein